MLEGKYRRTKEYLLIYYELITAARYHGTTTYQALAQMAGLPLTGSYMGSELGKLLGEIVEDEHRCGRPMLSAVVVGTDGRPHDGFFRLGQILGKLTEDSPDARRLFWDQELQAVYQVWARTFKSGSGTAREAATRVATSKYQPLRTALSSIAPTIGEIRMTFAEIEDTLRAELPPSARRHRPWWANPGNAAQHTHAQSWLAAGWEVAAVNLDAEWVLFRRRAAPAG